MDPFLDPNSDYNKELQAFANKKEAPTEVATAQTPVLESTPEQQAANEAQAQATRFGVPFNVNMPEAVPSTALNNDITTEDVFARRNELEAQQGTGLDSISVPDAEVTPFDDPEAFIRSQLFGDDVQSAAEVQQQESLGRSREITEGITEDLTAARREAEQTTGIGSLQSELARTNEKIALRQARFRREMREFKEDATQRGYAREFVQRDLAKMEADATAELADLSIIQNAQQGNVEAARGYIKTAVDNKYRFIESELAAEQARLAELMPTLEGEAKKEAQQLEFALNERANNIEAEKAEEEKRRELVIAVGAEGAPENVRRSIMSGNIDEAFVIAGRWMGKLDREIKQQQYYNSILTGRKSKLELDLLQNPPQNTKIVDDATLEAINGLSDGQRNDLNSARQTMVEIDRMKELINSVDDITLLTRATEEGREFNRLADNVADKLARKRTGAVVGKEEEKTFKRILGVGAFNQLASSDEEIISALDNMRGLHSTNVDLIDPTGEIGTWLDSRSLKVTSSENEEINAIWGVSTDASTPDFNPSEFYGSNR